LQILELRWWVGIWTGVFCIIIVVTDGSAAVKYITRYTEESFATLISVIFIVDGLKKMVHIHDKASIGKVKISYLSSIVLIFFPLFFLTFLRS
jgi:hypothetical protein